MARHSDHILLSLSEKICGTVIPIDYLPLGADDEGGIGSPFDQTAYVSKVHSVMPLLK